jgi:hypothetical protein
MERIVRTDFRMVHDFSKAAALPLLPTRLWTAAEWDRIQLGYRARGMDERWHAFTEGNQLFLHRSWTGHRIYEAEFAPAPDGGEARVITRARVETDPRRHRRASDAHDAAMLELLVGSVLLGERSDAQWRRLTELRGRPRADHQADAAPRHSMLGLRPVGDAPDAATEATR